MGLGTKKKELMKLLKKIPETNVATKLFFANSLCNTEIGAHFWNDLVYLICLKKYESRHKSNFPSSVRNMF